MKKPIRNPLTSLSLYPFIPNMQPRPYLIPIPLQSFDEKQAPERTPRILLRFAGASEGRTYYAAVHLELFIVMRVPVHPTRMNGRHAVAWVGWEHRASERTKLTVLKIVNIRADDSKSGQEHAKKHRLRYLSFDELLKNVKVGEER